MKKYICLCLLILIVNVLQAQKISGKLTAMSGQTIKLEGFKGFQIYTISTSNVDKSGFFNLSYGKTDTGMGYLISEDNKPLFVVLSGEDIEINGLSTGETNSIDIVKGFENQQFARYASEQPKREQVLSAWGYLDNIYRQDTFFSSHMQPIGAIAEEKKRLNEEELVFLQQLPSNSYVRWFLPVRRLVSTVSTIAQYRPDEIPVVLQSLRQLDLADPRLQKSGLLKDALEGHFWLIENSGKPLESVFADMRISIDMLVQQLSTKERELNDITNYLFDLLERHSLFEASEYLALKVLQETSCTIDNNLAKQLETYRAMKKGNIAPDIEFSGKYLYPGYNSTNKPLRISALSSAYTLVVFGASWCPKCAEEVPEIGKLYAKWKAQGVDVVFVSLDESEKEYLEFSSKLPFISVCDYKKWQSPVVEAYYVFATPTMYLLGDKREIILRPNSVKQIDAWVDWFLIQGNKK